jgi:hypothetical protein
MRLTPKGKVYLCVVIAIFLTVVLNCILTHLGDSFLYLIIPADLLLMLIYDRVVAYILKVPPVFTIKKSGFFK